MTGGNFLTEAADLLRPHVEDLEERKALFKEALFGRDIDADLPFAIPEARVFAVNALHELFKHGRMADGDHPVVLVLERVRDRRGDASIKRRVDDLCARIEDQEPGPRQRELTYLDWIEEQFAVSQRLYTSLRGHGTGSLPDDIGSMQGDRAVVPRTPHRARARRTYLHRAADTGDRGGIEPRATERRYEDVTLALDELRQAVFVGDPGAGKSSTLWAIAESHFRTARTNPTAPLPILVLLGDWLSPDPSFATFLEGAVGPLADDIRRLLDERRAVLLLDGLNEFPVADRLAKAASLRDFLSAHRDTPTAVTCRDLDYGDPALDLKIARVEIEPLLPSAIRQMIADHLAVERSHRDPDSLFWRLAGGSDVEAAFADVARHGVDLDTALSRDRLPHAIEHFRDWRSQRVLESVGRDERSLLRLAANPFMLTMFIDEFIDTGTVPANRALLFEAFVGRLLVREGLAGGAAAEAYDPEAPPATTISPEGEAILGMLERLAWTLQEGRADAEGRSAATVFIASPAMLQAEDLSLALVFRARSASFLTVDGDNIRFTHQLLQEYFAARALRARIDPDPRAFPATNLWKRPVWWKPTNWEETAILLAGLYPDDCTPVIRWLEVTNPEVAARCIMESGAHTPDATRRRMRALWLPRLTDFADDPMPEARAAIGRAVGTATITDGGPMLDDRPGVGLDAHGLPDVRREEAWCEVPAGPFLMGSTDDDLLSGDDEKPQHVVDLPRYWIARYPVTYAQYRAFVEADDGYRDPRWWRVPTKLDREDEAGRQEWPIGSHPAENVSWYDAMAFCRWLSHLVGGEVRLPTEAEWEKAARGTDGRVYSWGDTYEPGRANIYEPWDDVDPHALGRTTAVGLYDQANPYVADDTCGNVWEWTSTDYDSRADADPASDGLRVVRGGSWGDFRGRARAACRLRDRPAGRVNYLGFRLVVSSPIW